MAYNIHPIIVHFPIALLVAYSVIKILPMRKWVPQVQWRDIEIALLVGGVLGAFASLSTGESAEHLIRPDRQIVEMHAFFGSLSTWLYGLLLAGPVAELLVLRYGTRLPQVVTGLLSTVARVCAYPFILWTLVVGGLVAITVTGLLGGVMVYGSSADPLAPIVLRVLGL